MTNPDPWALLSVVVEQAPAAQCPRLLGELEKLKASLWLRMTTGSQACSTQGTDRLLTADEVAERLNVTPAFIYKKARQYPFTIRQGRYVRFSQNGLERYLKQRQGG